MRLGALSRQVDALLQRLIHPPRRRKRARAEGTRISSSCYEVVSYLYEKDLGFPEISSVSISCEWNNRLNIIESGTIEISIWNMQYLEAWIVLNTIIYVCANAALPVSPTVARAEKLFAQRPWRSRHNRSRLTVLRNTADRSMMLRRRPRRACEIDASGNPRCTCANHTPTGLQSPFCQKYTPR